MLKISVLRFFCGRVYKSVADPEGGRGGVRPPPKIASMVLKSLKNLGIFAYISGTIQCTDMVYHSLEIVQHKEYNYNSFVILCQRKTTWNTHTCINEAVDPLYFLNFWLSVVLENSQKVLEMCLDWVLLNLWKPLI